MSAKRLERKKMCASWCPALFQEYQRQSAIPPCRLSSCPQCNVAMSSCWSSFIKSIYFRPPRSFFSSTVWLLQCTRHSDSWWVFVAESTEFDSPKYIEPVSAPKDWCASLIFRRLNLQSLGDLHHAGTLLSCQGAVQVWPSIHGWTMLH